MQPVATYPIPSATTPGTTYTVSRYADGVLTCDCPDATYRRRQCKHQRQALVMWTAAGRAGAFAGEPVETPVETPVEKAARLAWENEGAAHRSAVAGILGRW